MINYIYLYFSKNIEFFGDIIEYLKYSMIEKMIFVSHWCEKNKKVFFVCNQEQSLT